MLILHANAGRSSGSDPRHPDLPLWQRNLINHPLFRVVKRNSPGTRNHSQFSRAEHCGAFRLQFFQQIFRLGFGPFGRLPILTVGSYRPKDRRSFHRSRRRAGPLQYGQVRAVLILIPLDPSHLRMSCDAAQSDKARTAPNVGRILFFNELYLLPDMNALSCPATLSPTHLRTVLVTICFVDS